MKFEQLFKEIQELQEFAYKRAKPMLDATENPGKVILESYEYDDFSITVKFMEDTRYDCPDYFSVSLSADDLELSDEEWDKKVEWANQKRLDTMEKLSAEKQSRQQASKEAEYERLKKELNK